MTEIQQATIENFKELLDLIIEFELEKQTLYDNDDMIDNNKLIKQFTKSLKTYLNDNSYNYLIFKQNKLIIGYIFLSYGDIYLGEGYINEVYVIPSERKNGVGQILLKQGINWLKHNNCKTIDITVNRKNKPALSLYKKNKFTNFIDDYIPMRKNI